MPNVQLHQAEHAEQSVDPSAPSADRRRIYTRDDTTSPPGFYDQDDSGTAAYLLTELTAIAGGGTELTIATGAITITSTRHTVDTEADAASDDLDTINGGFDGQIVVLSANNDARSVVIKNGTGNILTWDSADITLDEDHKLIALLYDGTNWLEIGSSAGSGGGGSIGGSTGSTDNAVLRADGTGGSTVQASGLTITDSGKLTIPDNATVGALNLTERSAEPSAPASGDIYLDDGTNTDNGVQSLRRYDGAAWEDLPGLYTYTDVIYVSKDGDDTNDGTSPEAPKLTIGSAITAASGLTPSSTNRILIQVIDAGVYTENPTLAAHIDLDARAATIVGELEIVNDCYAHVNRHFANTNNNVLTRGSGNGYAHYRCNVLDGRGTAGSLTGKRNVVSGGSGSVLFADVDVMFVSASGEGLRDVAAGFGHVHIHVKDLYLAGSNSRGVYGFNGNSNFIGHIDHILEVGSPTGTTAISNTGSPAIMELVIGEIVCDTAFDVNNGSVSAMVSKIDATTLCDVESGAALNLTCPDASGTILNDGTITGMIGGTWYGADTIDGLSSATVATDDKVVVLDTDDSDNLKTVTAQAIADLASAGSVNIVSTSSVYSPASAYQTTSTTFADVDGTNVQATLTLNGNGRTFVSFTFAMTSVATDVRFRISDGTNVSGTFVTNITSQEIVTISAIFDTTGQSGSTTYTLQFASGGTGRVLNNADIIINAMEIS